MTFLIDNFISKIEDYYNFYSSNPSLFVKSQGKVNFQTNIPAIYYFLKIMSDKIIKDLPDEEEIKYKKITGEQEKEILDNISFCTIFPSNFAFHMQNYIIILKQDLRELQNNFTELQARKYTNIAQELLYKIRYFAAVSINIIPIILNPDNEIYFDHHLSNCYITEHHNIMSKCIARYNHYFHKHFIVGCDHDFYTYLIAYDHYFYKYHEPSEKVLPENLKKPRKKFIRSGKVKSKLLTSQELIILRRDFDEKIYSFDVLLYSLYSTKSIDDIITENKTRSIRDIIRKESDSQIIHHFYQLRYSFKCLCGVFNVDEHGLSKLITQETIYLNHDLTRFILKNYKNFREILDKLGNFPREYRDETFAHMLKLFSNQFCERQFSAIPENIKISYDRFLSCENIKLKNLLFNYGYDQYTDDKFILKPSLAKEYEIIFDKLNEIAKNIGGNLDQNLDQIISARYILLHRETIKKCLGTDISAIKIFEEKINIIQTKILYILAICKEFKIYRGSNPILIQPLYDRLNFYLSDPEEYRDLLIASSMNEKEIIEKIEEHIPIMEKALYEAIDQDNIDEISYIKKNMQAKADHYIKSKNSNMVLIEEIDEIPQKTDLSYTSNKSKNKSDNDIMPQIKYSRNF